MEANQPANPESGEGHSQHEEAGTKGEISIGVTLKERFRTMMDSDASVKEDKGRKPFIGQVPMLLGMESELNKYFQPRIMSIGPLHYGKNNLMQGQQFKLQLAKHFIEKSNHSKEILYNKILEEIERFKKCYDPHELLEKFHGNNEDLAWMFLVDGCALIQFVKRYVLFGWIVFDYMNIGRDQVNLMATDLILLDNQLPFKVLDLIMEIIKEEHCFRILIRDFAKEIMEMKHFEGWGKKPIVKRQNHMLELIWMKFVQKGKADTTLPTPRLFLSVEHLPISEPTSHFRGVKDLQAAGIILEPNNSSSSLRDISFNRGNFFCKLKIPRFHVSEQGKFLVFNLMAFEMHPNFEEDRVVTSYISFLNSLIATKEDVVELRKAGILFNYLSKDDEVLKTFQELTSTFKPYPDIFSSTKEELINYFSDKKSMRKGKWLSEAIHVYFRSPWTTIAFISASFLLMLTCIQTLFSVLAYIQRK